MASSILGLQAHLFTGTFVVLICTTTVCLLWRRRQSVTPSAQGQDGIEQRSDEPEVLGEWKSQKFPYPKITPLSSPLSEIKPISYRPFRPGKYNVTMGIRNMQWDDWIELDNQFEQYFQIRQHRIQTRGEDAIRVLKDNHNPQVRGGELAAIELVHELAAYLTARYPDSFQVKRHERSVLDIHSEPLAQLAKSTSGYCDWGWDGSSPIKSVTVVPVGVTYELPLHAGDGERAAERALEIAALLVQDDLALMIEGQDGKYYFQAGAIVVPGFWRMQDKIGKRLDEIHTSGDVPQYREKLQGSMDRFFRRMRVDKPVVRNNYFFQVVRSQEEPSPERMIDPEELGWSTYGNGPEDEFSVAHSFQFDRTGEGAPRPEELRLRTERQTLRRLGISGAIVFTIRTYLVPVRSVREERGMAGRLASALRGWPEEVKEYKGVYRGGWWEMLLNFLDDNM